MNWYKMHKIAIEVSDGDPANHQGTVPEGEDQSNDSNKEAQQIYEEKKPYHMTQFNNVWNKYKIASFSYSGSQYLDEQKVMMDNFIIDCKVSLMPIVDSEASYMLSDIFNSFDTDWDNSKMIFMSSNLDSRPTEEYDFSYKYFYKLMTDVGNIIYNESVEEVI
jgi:hypothetical protein